MEDLRVTLVQGDTLWRDPAGNRAMYGELLARLTGQTDLVVLPETFVTGFGREALPEAEEMGGPTVAWMRAQAAALGAVVTGSLQLREGEAVFNRLIWATPVGGLHHYDKRHLFRMAGEHEDYGAGRDRITVEVKGWRVRPLVCYDLRFPVFLRNRFGAELPAGFDYDLLLFVANWPAARRTAWRTLLRARAIENLACTVGVNRVGTDGNGVRYAGDSAAIDFLGEPLLEFEDGVRVDTTVLSAAALRAHRVRFPAQLDADRFELL